MKYDALIDGPYRYWLTREWDFRRDRLGWIMLNPSKADAHRDDATLRRCIDYSQRWDYGSLVVVNLYAYRATNPDAMRSAQDPTGPDNARHVREQLARCEKVVAAWGAHPMTRACGHYGLTSLYCLGRTKSGAPVHPLRQPKSAQPILWLPKAEAARE